MGDGVGVGVGETGVSVGDGGEGVVVGEEVMVGEGVAVEEGVAVGEGVTVGEGASASGTCVGEGWTTATGWGGDGEPVDESSWLSRNPPSSIHTLTKAKARPTSNCFIPSDSPDVELFCRLTALPRPQKGRRGAADRCPRLVIGVI